MFRKGLLIILGSVAGWYAHDYISKRSDAEARKKAEEDAEDWLDLDDDFVDDLGDIFDEDKEVDTSNPFEDFESTPVEPVLKGEVGMDTSKNDELISHISTPQSKLQINNKLASVIREYVDYTDNKESVEKEENEDE